MRITHQIVSVTGAFYQQGNKYQQNALYISWNRVYFDRNKKNQLKSLKLPWFSEMQWQLLIEIEIETWLYLKSLQSD